MALGRRAAAPVKIVLALDGEGGLVDPAIDIENSDIVEYWKSMFNIEHIKFHKGQQPTRFLIRPLTRRQRDATDLLTGSEAMKSWYIRCGIVKLFNYHIMDGKGEVGDAPHPELKKHGEVGEIATEEWLDKVCFTTDVKFLLYTAIYALSEAKLPLSEPSRQESGGQKSEAETSTVSP
jgi:hypothetical protein